MTRDLDWGVDIDIAGFENKKMYVWIEAVLGYVTATMKYCEENNLDWKKYWKNDEATIYMVHGKDNITFHSIICQHYYYQWNQTLNYLTRWWLVSI